MNCSEMIDKLLKGEISRKEFLKYSGIAAFLYLVGVPVLDESKSYITKGIKSLSSRLKDDYEKALLLKIFGNLPNQSKFIPGTSHHLFPGEMHPDDQIAAATLANAMSLGIKELKIVDNFITLKNLEGMVVALGSPVSNYLSRIVMTYEYIDKDPSKGLVRDKEKSFFDLPFEFVMDADMLSKSGATAKRIIKGSVRQVPNWSLYSNIKNKLMVPIVSDDGQLKSDYLLITVVPNFFSKMDYDSGKTLILFAGTHGVGTKAVELLFRDEKLLKKLLKQVEHVDYWQAVIKVDKVIPRIGKKKRAEPFSISEKIHCAPIHFKRSQFEEKLKV